MITFYHDTEQDFGIKVDVQACRQVVSEFIRIEQQYGVSATYNVVGKIYQEQPELIDQIARGGHEIAFHSFRHTYDPESYSSEIALCRQLSSAVKGYRSPRSQWNAVTLRALWENEFLWNAENDPSREPYFIHYGLVRLPVATCDWDIHINRITEEQWCQLFADLMNERRYFGFGTHDCVVSLKPELRLKAYEKVIQIAQQNKALIVNFSEAADFFRKAALAKSSKLGAKDWYHAINRFQQKHPPRPGTRMKQIEISDFRFEIRNRQRDAYIKSFGKYVPEPVRKIVRKLPYFKSM